MGEGHSREGSALGYSTEVRICREYSGKSACFPRTWATCVGVGRAGKAAGPPHCGRQFRCGGEPSEAVCTRQGVGGDIMVQAGLSRLPLPRELLERGRHCASAEGELTGA